MHCKHIKTSLNYLTLIWLLALIFWGLGGCDAPRDNPFDPDAENYTAPVQTTITVKSLYPPFSPVSGVRLMEPELNLFGRSDPSGRVVWQHSEIESLLVVADSPDYFADTVSFQPMARINNFSMFLNARPVINGISFYSLYGNFGKVTYLYLSSTIADNDGPIDIDRVILSNMRYNFSDTLSRSINDNNSYETSLAISEIDPSLTAEMVPELSFELVVKNTDGRFVRSEEFSIRRVIVEQLTLNGPESNSTAPLSGPVTFSWEPVNLNYDFKYVLYIIRGMDNKLIANPQISSNETSFVLNSLETGNYYWYLEVVDQLNNKCQSEFKFFWYVR